MLLALALALGIAAAEDRPVHGRIAVGLRVLCSCGVAVVGGSWVMRWIHG